MEEHCSAKLLIITGKDSQAIQRGMYLRQGGCIGYKTKQNESSKDKLEEQSGAVKEIDSIAFGKQLNDLKTNIKRQTKSHH